MATIAPPPEYAGAMGGAVMRARAKVRADLRAGHVTWEQLLRDPPAVVSDMLLIDILRLPRQTGQRKVVALTKLGRKALDDQINLMLPLRITSQRQRQWMVDHGLMGVHTARWSR